MKKVLLNEQYPEFILTHVVRPYQGMLGREKTITHLRYVPFGDNETGLNYFELQNYAWEAKYEEWFKSVIERLAKIYKQCDYSFFPQDDFFANTLKRKMIEAGIKGIETAYWMPSENYPIELGFAENVHRYNELSELVPELVNALNVCFKSLCTYGHHGVVKKVEDESKDPVAIFGFLIHVELDNGKMVLVEKSEHISKIK